MIILFCKVVQQNLKTLNALFVSKLVYYFFLQQKMQVQIKVSYGNQTTRSVLVTVQAIGKPPYSDTLENVMTINIGSTQIHLKLLTVGSRTAVRVHYRYPLQPRNVLPQSGTIIMFPNLPSVEYRPSLILNMTHYLGLSPYRRGPNVTTIVNVPGSGALVLTPVIGLNNYLLIPFIQMTIVPGFGWWRIETRLLNPITVLYLFYQRVQEEWMFYGRITFTFVGAALPNPVPDIRTLTGENFLQLYLSLGADSAALPAILPSQVDSNASRQSSLKCPDEDPGAGSERK